MESKTTMSLRISSLDISGITRCTQANTCVHSSALSRSTLSSHHINRGKIFSQQVTHNRFHSKITYGHEGTIFLRDRLDAVLLPPTYRPQKLFVVQSLPSEFVDPYPLLCSSQDDTINTTIPIQL